MASIDSFKRKDTYRMHLEAPDGSGPVMDEDGNELWIEITHNNSPEFQRLKNEYRDKELQGRLTRSASAEKDRLVNLMAACTKGWNLRDANGPIAFSEKAARDIYRDPDYDWILDAVVVGTGNRANFMGESSAA